MNIRVIITKLLTQALASIGINSDGVPDKDIDLEHPSDINHGDYACNIAMRLARKIGKNPRSLASDIVANLPQHDFIEGAEVAGPGFINFYLSNNFFSSGIKEALKAGGAWGSVDTLKGKTVLVEHSSPNLFKPFHIGHLVNNTYGESLARIIKNAGAHVITLSFPSDVSPGIAKAVWGIMHYGWENELDIEKLGEAYVAGVRAYKENEDAKKRIDEINKNIYLQKEQTKEFAIYKIGKELSLDHFLHITKLLGSHFDKLVFETEAETVGKEIIRQNIPEVFEESDGAVIFRGSKYGLFDNVYINSAGFGTYLAKDTGLLKIKFDNYSFDESVTITDIEQKQHFELLKKSAECINKEWAKKSRFLQHGRLSLTTGKLSSRDGGAPLAIDMINSVKESAMENSRASGGKLTEEYAQQVAIGAIKYFIAKVSMGRNIIFDMDKSLSFEGNSGPYLQYTYARCLSLIKNANFNYDIYDFNVPDNWKATLVERLLYRFPEISERAVIEYSSHHVANYLNELASAYNSWYAKEKILDGTNAENYKLAITQTVANTLKNGLYLLGIDAPDRM